MIYTDSIGNRLINGLTIACMTRATQRDKLNQLYEQGVSARDIGRYVERWELFFCMKGFKSFIIKKI